MPKLTCILLQRDEALQQLKALRTMLAENAPRAQELRAQHSELRHARDELAEQNTQLLARLQLIAASAVTSARTSAGSLR